jgi:hypothetical protein
MIVGQFGCPCPVIGMPSKDDGSSQLPDWVKRKFGKVKNVDRTS